ncbi:MAG: helix-turn-helix domain containing protein [Myxococcales bacterium]|nr:helix-turn-helix domain containing protein [Myxococcales bacterium]
MARKLDPNRLEDLAQAGFRAFAEKGFRRTQMLDVARELGVSAGSLYNYVASKEALFLLVLQRQNQDEPLALPEELPLSAPSEDDFLVEIRKALRRRVKMAALAEAVEAPCPADCADEFEGVVRSIYQDLSRGRGVLILLERSAADWPALSAQYGGSTSRYLKRLTSYLGTRADAGKLRVGPSVHASARLIAETCAWFAMRRPLAHRSGIDDETAEATVVDTLCRAFLPVEPARKNPGPKRNDARRNKHV